MRINGIRKYIIAAALLFPMAAAAQTFQTGYFLDGYVYKYRLNPAFQGESGFFGVTPLSNTDLSFNSNIGVSSFVFPKDGRLVTGFHPDVRADEFLGNLHKNNTLDINTDLNILAFGFRTKKLYHTFDVTANVNATASLPYDMFRLLKDGTRSGSDFDMTNLYASASCVGQVAYGISYKINDKWSAGLRVKALVGLARVNAKMENFKMHLGEDEWEMNTKMSLTASGMNVAFKYVVDEQGKESIAGFLPSGFAIGGIGAALDLGVTYKPVDFVTLSASVLNLGAMSWNKSIYAETPGVDVKYTPSENIDFNGGSDNGIDDQLDEALDQLTSLLDLTEMPIPSSLERLKMTVNVGAECEIPSYRSLSFGLLGTMRNDSFSNFLELRASVNFAPCKWFALSVSGAKNTFGWNYGAAMNIHTVPFKVFIGADSFVSTLSPEFIPIDKNPSLNLRAGVCFGFGKRAATKVYGRYNKKKK